MECLGISLHLTGTCRDHNLLGTKLMGSVFLLNMNGDDCQKLLTRGYGLLQGNMSCYSTSIKEAKLYFPGYQDHQARPSYQRDLQIFRTTQRCRRQGTLQLAPK